ncbi:MAG: hypothetical protein M3220_12430 [Chloroflexota bacterium]|nr:hypothetical protein [Chloroflexota bacterium]
MSETRHHDIPMPEPVAATLQALESQDADSPHRVDPAAGPVYYALVKAVRPQRLLLMSGDPLYATLWVALATQGQEVELYVAGEEGAEAVSQTMAQVGQDGSLTLLQAESANGSPPVEGPFDLLLLDLNAIRYAVLWEQMREALSPEALFIAAGAIQQEERLDALRQMLAQTPRWRQAVIDKGSGLLVAAQSERALQYEESALEAFMALFLHAMQPANLVLGQNVVFDGAIKPPVSKVNFSGVGGQIGAGDLLITYPDDLQRYTPSPGAVALVLGELPTPIRTPNVVLPLGDEVVTLVVA